MERDGVRLSCRHWGGSGPPFVLLHGLAGHAGAWDALARVLSRAPGHRAVDQRHGAAMLTAAGRRREQGTGVATVEQTRRTLETAAELQDGIRARAVARGPRPEPAPVTVPPPCTQRPGIRHTPGRTPEGVA
ncbi:alpha/beta fold hydrolase [Streptomyces sparsogenes]|uniref:alpha/beta fold hydrolase n=1 Tax=Streptomyces sparsogenes TaxID=67365 RepID=UPI003F4D6E99